MYAKLHEMRGMRVVACCDRSLLGRLIEDGEISFRADEGFYGREETTPEELAEMLETADSANLLGKKAVEVALRKGFIKESAVIKVKGIPHAQIFKI